MTEFSEKIRRRIDSGTTDRYRLPSRMGEAGNRIVVGFAVCLVLSTLSLSAIAEDALPDAPIPQLEGPQDAQRPSTETPPQTSSSDQNAPQTAPEAGAEQKGQPDTAAEQVRAQEKQRIMFVMPNFNTSYISNAATLSPKQKMHLAFRSATDPFALVGPFIVASLDVGLNEEPVFGLGAKGYFQHAGAAYLDVVNGIIIGNGILPIVLHQDPRFFRRGHGSFGRRISYAIATSFICKHDNSGRWEPNYSNIGGNLAAGAISTLYYPADESGWGRVLANAMIVTAQGAILGSINEFWPDISRKLFHKDPTNGRDSQAAATDPRDKSEKKQPLPENPNTNPQ